MATLYAQKLTKQERRELKEGLMSSVAFPFLFFQLVRFVLGIEKVAEANGENPILDIIYIAITYLITFSPFVHHCQ
jgi:hypothetical protein